MTAPSSALLFGQHGIEVTPPVVGGFAEAGRDDFETAAPSGTQSDLSAHTPTPGVWVWEYTGATTRYLIAATTDYAPGGEIAGGVTSVMARTDRDFDHSTLQFRVWADVKRKSSASVGAHNCICVAVPNTAIGSFANGDCIIVRLYSDGNSNVAWYLAHATVAAELSSGGVDLATPTSRAWAISTDKRVIVEIDGDTVNVYEAVYGTGASETLVFTGTIPTSLLTMAGGVVASTRQRVGLYGQGNDHLTFMKYTIEEQQLAAPGIEGAVLWEAQQGVDDDGTAFEIYAVSNWIAPAGTAGECIFYFAYVTITWSMAVDLLFKPIVDRVADTTVATPFSLEVLEVPLTLPTLAGGQRHTQTFKIPLMTKIMRSAVDRGRNYVSGSRLRLEIQSSSGLAEGALLFDGVEVEYEITSEVKETTG